MKKLIQIHTSDNIYVVCREINPGDIEIIEEREITFTQKLGLGHKIAATDISKGAQVIKFGVSIGKATEDIVLGSHVHLHNLKSDYISTYTLKNEFIQTK